jgi:hypothetical protein
MYEHPMNEFFYYGSCGSRKVPKLQYEKNEYMPMGSGDWSWFLEALESAVEATDSDKDSNKGS